MRKLLVFAVTAYMLASCSMVSQDPYARGIEKYRYSKDSFLKFSNTSPLEGKQRTTFMKLYYFDIDSNYKVKADYEALKTPLPVTIESTGDNGDQYYKVGTLHFTLKGQKLVLSVYQRSDFLSSPNYGNELFLPFSDASNGKSTYEGGRFMDVAFTGGTSIVLDFNYAYNPYCAYNHNYSCPVPPAENKLPIAVEAGEKAYTQTVSIM